ncbi:MAG: putative ferric reductase [Myxococcaceae bacterium]|nr:putative ferric reductase [Myxococcaceae bacterium]
MATTRQPSTDEHLLERLERAFDVHAGADAVIDAGDLKRALGFRDDYLAKRMLAAFDTDKDGVLQKGEFLAAVRKIMFGTAREKLELAFVMHDHDGDGAIEPVELVRMITLGLAEDDVTVDSGHAERLAQRVFADADRNGDGRISFDEFASALEGRHDLLLQMTRSEARWIAPNEDILARLDAPRRTRVAEIVANRWPSIAIVLLFILANAVVFAATLLQPTRRPTPEILKLADACAACLNLDAALIVIPVLRRILTRVRATRIGRIVPVDDAIDFHRLVGWSIVVFGLAHGAGHLAAWVQKVNPHLQTLLSKEGVTGLLLVAVVLVMWFFARKAIRRTRHFELFYFTHLLYLAFFALAALLAPSLLGWAAVPLLGLVFEQISRRRMRSRVTAIAHAQALRSGVTRIAIAKPTDFVHRAGDYVFLRVPAVARHEWHPFTISSAPESKDLVLHIRSLGNWTDALRRLVEAGGAVDVPAHLDGPYGSPSGHVFEAKNAVLVGAGIGVTPFASVLESLVWRANGKSNAPTSLKKAHFFWLNRDQYSFEWFTALLADLERIDRKDLLDIHIWMTGGRGGLTAAGLEVARDLVHTAGEADIVTGLRAKTHMGHPDWATTLREIRDAHAPERVDVFFCGPLGLGRKLRPVCESLGMRFRDERF